MNKEINSYLNPETIRRDFDEQYEQYISDGSDNNPHTLGWDRDPILLTPEQEDIVESF